MAKLYNFERLVTKYSEPVTLVQYAKGEFIEGRFQKGDPTETVLMGAVVPFAERKMYRSGGYLKSTDRQMYTLERITGSLEGSQIVHKGKTYAIEEDTDHTSFSDVSVYILRWVESK